MMDSEHLRLEHMSFSSGAHRNNGKDVQRENKPLHNQEVGTADGNQQMGGRFQQILSVTEST